MDREKLRRRLTLYSYQRGPDLYAMYLDMEFTKCEAIGLVYQEAFNEGVQREKEREQERRERRMARYAARQLVNAPENTVTEEANANER